MNLQDNRFQAGNGQTECEALTDLLKCDEADM